MLTRKEHGSTLLTFLGKISPSMSVDVASEELLGTTVFTVRRCCDQLRPDFLSTTDVVTCLSCEWYYG